YVSADAWQGYIDRSGRRFLPIPQGLIGGSEFHDGLARVRTSDGGIGYIDKTGTIVVNPQRVLAGDFSEGLAAVCNFKNVGITCRYIDKTGATVIEADSSWPGVFSEGLAPVCVDLSPVPKKKCGYIDKTG